MKTITVFTQVVTFIVPAQSIKLANREDEHYCKQRKRKRKRNVP